MDIACYKVVLAKKGRKKTPWKWIPVMWDWIFCLASLSSFFYLLVFWKKKKGGREMGWMGGCWGYSFSKRLDYIFCFFLFLDNLGKYKLLVYSLRETYKG
jgi:hypothetical protein